MKRREWAALAVLGALVVVMIVVGVRVLGSSGGHSGAAGTPTPSSGSTAAPPPPPSTQDSPSNDGDAVVPGSDLAAAHRVMTAYVSALRSYTSDDRQGSWQQDALAETDDSPAMRTLTRLPTGKAWAECVHTHCRVTSSARILRDTSVTNLPGAGARRQVVSYVNVDTVAKERGARPERQSSQFIVTAVKAQDGWKVTGCAFAGIGDAGENGDGP